MSLSGPHAGCSKSCTIPRARTVNFEMLVTRNLPENLCANPHLPCSCSNVSFRSLTLAYGKPVPSKIFSHSSVVFVLVMSSMPFSRVSRFATRDELVENLSSVAHLGTPRPTQRTLKRRSLAPPTRKSPSLVRNARYGTTDADKGTGSVSGHNGSLPNSLLRLTM